MVVDPASPVMSNPVFYDTVYMICCFSGRVVCSDGWLLLNRVCYFFSEERKSRAESGRSCRFLQAKLATVKPTQIILTVSSGG